MHRIFNAIPDTNTVLTKQKHPVAPNYQLPTMSNLKDTDSASSDSAFEEMVRIKREEMPNVTKEHLQTLCQRCVDKTLIKWAMENSERKCNFIQAVKHAMTHNNL